MNITKTIAAVSIITALTTSASFAEKSGFYIQGSLGFNQLQDTDQSGAPGTVASDYDSGYNISVAIGKHISAWPGVRAEIELSYSENDADTINFSGNGPGAEGNVNGDISSTSIRANVLYDFKTGNSKITPYIGAGIGVSFIDSSISYGGVPVRIDDDNAVFSAQLIAGAAYKLSDTLELVLDARYSRAFGVELTRVSPAGAAIVDDDFDNLSVNLGLRFAF